MNRQGDHVISFAVTKRGLFGAFLTVLLLAAIGGLIWSGLQLKAAQQEVRTLQQVADSKERALTELNGRLTSARNEVKRYAEQLNQAETQLKAAQGELTKAGGQLTQARTRLGQTQRQLGSAQEELKTERVISEAAFSVSRENLQNYCRSLDNEVLLAQNSLKNLRGQLRIGWK